MDLTTLPDDALLEVLGYLGTRQLLQCRGVCRRLRDAALHPLLWRNRHLRLGKGSEQLVGAVLRLAPCLYSLTLRLDDRIVKLYHKLGNLLAQTDCAVSALEVQVYHRTGAPLLASMALLRQAALGRLEYVSIRASSAKKSDLRLLLDQLLHIPGLTCVEVERHSIFEDPPTLVKAAVGQSVPPSLERLVYGAQDGTLPSYLQWHAETLQVVHLESRQLPAGTAALLGALPNLRDLKCPVLDGMPALLQCRALDTLYLVVRVNETTRPLLRGVQQYLRQAAALLETLTLDYDQDETCEDAHDLLLSLHPEKGHRGTPSPLRSLTLEYGEFARRPQPHLQRLASVLPRLGNLVSLDLNGPPTAELFEAMDGRVVPRLERLGLRLVKIGPAEDWGGGCPHKWAHGDEPRTLLRRYPRLHIEVMALHLGDGCSYCEYKGCDFCECAYCAANSCHDFDADIHVLYSHADHDTLCKTPGEVGILVA